MIKLDLSGRTAVITGGGSVPGRGMGRDWVYGRGYRRS